MHLIPSMSRGDAREKRSDAPPKKKEKFATKMSENEGQFFSFFNFFPLDNY